METAAYGNALVPLDGSQPAERALDYAKRLAVGSGGRIIIIAAIHGHAPRGTDAAQAQVEDIRNAELTLSEHVAGLKQEGIRADQHVYCGQPGHVILKAIHDLGADIVVMSTHGHSGLRRVVYGTVADQVLRHSTVPVLLVPLNCEQSWISGSCQIVLPLDGSELAEEAVQPAARLAASLGAGITLLEVVQPTPVANPDDAALAFDADIAMSKARGYLTTVEGRPEVASVCTEKLALVGQPAATICAEAEREHAAAIVMATHGMGGVAHLVLGSVATSVLQTCRRPLLLICPKAIAGHPNHVQTHAGVPR